MTNKIKDPSPLVEAVLRLDSYLSEIVRLGDKIQTMDLKSDFDFEQAQKLMSRFAECGQGVSDQVVHLSQTLNEARAKAEAAAEQVAARAAILEARHNEHQQKMDAFRILGEKVSELTLSLSDLKRPEGSTLSDEDRVSLSKRLTDFDVQLEPLIQEARDLRTSAQESKIKTLEHSADSLVQRLTAIRARLETFQKTELTLN
ncbi:hypothetical protein [Bdellovibrio reynosensis]|uniref:Uncharacterized protein n=1 Tax=Bdellovibrio reynosensis TaxID=2835041 RepID=A0ABY4CF56_9BACT|nr:hypothetical protein [Bdellovibrio reynosensis]UOF02173.1 hypothetical protein MNR06_04295 [Bdellovibrio reynosensis]